MPPKKIKQVSDDEGSDSDSSKKTTKKNPAKKASTTAAAKKKATAAKDKNDDEEPVKKTRVMKSFTKTGQKKETPEELDGLRLFYESLHREKPDSEMAARWCIQHGIFEDDVHNKLVKKWGVGPGTKAAPAAKKDTTASTPKKAAVSPRRKKANNDDEDSAAEYAPRGRAATASSSSLSESDSILPRRIGLPLTRRLGCGV